MVDRQARDELANIIESYLDEQITAFEFDEKIFDVAGRSDDEAVRHVAYALWSCYDDCIDHTVVLSREQWNYFQRLLLLLRSNAELRIDRHRTWSWHHALATAGLAGFILLAIRLGFGEHLLVVATPFGVLSMLIAWLRSKLSEMGSDEWMRLIPFSSLPEMLAVRRRVAGFRKRRYPNELEGKSIRSPFMERLVSFQIRCSWLVFSPFVLLVQSLPDCDERTTVVSE